MATIKNFLRAAEERWDRLETVLGGLFVTLSVLVVLIQIAVRTAWGTSISGADEISRFLIIWGVFFTASIGVKRNIHVRVDVLLYVIPPRVRWLLEIAGSLVAMGFAAYLAYSGSVLVGDSIWMNERMVGSVRLPMWIPQLALPVGGVLLVIRLLQRVAFLLRHGTAAMEQQSPVGDVPGVDEGGTGLGAMSPPQAPDGGR